MVVSKRIITNQRNFFKIIRRYLQETAQNVKKEGIPAGTKTSRATFIDRVKSGPTLKEFLQVKPVTSMMSSDLQQSKIPYLESLDFNGKGKKVFFEIYGCQMNTNDSEVVWSVLKEHDFKKCENIDEADVILLVTCAVREGAERKIWNRLKHLHAMKEKRPAKKGSLQIGLLGCMAERLKEKLLEKEQCVDVIAGPDSYKDLPRLLALSNHYGNSAINVLLSLDETYADIQPVRLNSDSPTAFVSIMRGCDNMCTYCIVPFTRGRERSRPINSIVREIHHLWESGVKEVTLLGQNVNSYRDLSEKEENKKSNLAPGFKTVYKPKVGGKQFAELLEAVAESVPEMRIRFTSPHPKDFSTDVLRVIRDYPNICKNLHLPAQSGSNTVLDRMRRGYTREAYLELVQTIREYIPNVSLSSDFICGFCGETEEEFQDTLALINIVQYNVAYLFAYSMREKTTAHRRYIDDVPPEVKTERLQRMVKVFREGAAISQKKFVGQSELVLVEGKSKRSENYWFGRNDANIKVIIPNNEIPLSRDNKQSKKEIHPGDYVIAKITESNSQVLKGIPLYHSSIVDFCNNFK